MKETNKNIGLMIQAIQNRKWILRDSMSRDEFDFLNNLEWELRALYGVIANEHAQGVSNELISAQNDLIEYYENAIKNGAL